MFAGKKYVGVNVQDKSKVWNSTMSSLEPLKELDFCLVGINIVSKSFFHELVDHWHGFAVSVDVVALEFDDVVENFWKLAEDSFAGSSNVRRESDNVAIHENVKR